MWLLVSVLIARLYRHVKLDEDLVDNLTNKKIFGKLLKINELDSCLTWLKPISYRLVEKSCHFWTNRGFCKIQAGLNNLFFDLAGLNYNPRWRGLDMCYAYAVKIFAINAAPLIIYLPRAISFPCNPRLDIGKERLDN